MLKKQNCVKWINFIVYITTGYIHKNIVETRFYASYYELDCNCH